MIGADANERGRTGLGTKLMGHLETTGRNIGETEKVMLSCFTRNVRGIRFYDKLGFEKDEYSPESRILRDGTKVEADYIILSKQIQR